MVMDSIGKDTLEVMGRAKWYNKYLIGNIVPHLKDNILEIGFGTGNFTRSLSEYGEVTAIDINKEYLKNFIRENKKLDVGYGDIEKGKYFFKNTKFKTIICLNVLEHIKNEEIALKNMRNLLTDDGKLILLVPAHQVLFSKFDKLIGHYRRYTKNILSSMVKKSGWTIESIKYFNWISALGWYILIKIMKRMSMPKNEVGIFEKIAKYFLWTEKYIEPPFGLSILLIAHK